MEKIKVLVKPVKSMSGMVSLAAVKDVSVSEDLTLQKDKIFTSVTPWVFNKMSKPKTVLVFTRIDRLFVEPVY